MKLDVTKAMTIKLPTELPPSPSFDPKYRRAPSRGFNLSYSDTVTSLKNALRYIPKELHETLAPEFTLMSWSHTERADRSVRTGCNTG